MIMKHLLLISRYKNLGLLGIIVFTTQISLSYIQKHPLSWFILVYITFITICLAAAGYIINNYFDQQIDKINKPHQTINLKNNQYLVPYYLLNLAGIVLSFLLAKKIQNQAPLYLNTVIIFLLFLYSWKLKKTFLVGNLTIAFLSSYTYFFLFYVELISYPLLVQENQLVFCLWSGYFIFFCFITSLIREIAKDAQDCLGDKIYGAKTIPINLGNEKTLRLIHTLVKVTILILVIWNILLYIFIANFIFLLLQTILLYKLFLILKRSTNFKEIEIVFYQIDKRFKTIFLIGALSILGLLI